MMCRRKSRLVGLVIWRYVYVYDRVTERFQDPSCLSPSITWITITNTTPGTFACCFTWDDFIYTIDYYTEDD
jgi:hypothetical protein